MPTEPALTTVRFSVFADPRDQGRALASLTESPGGASPSRAAALCGLKKPLKRE
jgi:hypothetical protein